MASINDLMKNEEFLKGLVEVATPSELKELFEKNDIQLEDDLSIDEAFELVKKQKDAELDEEQLEDVNGGVAFAVAAGAVGALVLAGGVLCFISGYAYQKYQDWKKK